jgi:hypothetical protein
MPLLRLPKVLAILSRRSILRMYACIAGKGVANPLAQILSAALLLRYSFNLEAEVRPAASDTRTAPKRALPVEDARSIHGDPYGQGRERKPRASRALSVHSVLTVWWLCRLHSVLTVWWLCCLGTHATPP